MAVDLMACNILVIVTYIYCIFWRKEGEDDVTEPEETRNHTSKPGKSTDVGIVASATEISDGMTFTEISWSNGGTVRTFSTLENQIALESGVTTAQIQSGSMGLSSEYDERGRGA
jgi:hypothetical protein